MRVAVAQTQTGIDPDANLKQIIKDLRWAGAEGASLLATPEMALLLDRDRKRMAQHWTQQKARDYIKRLEDAVAHVGIALALGSLPWPLGEQDPGRFANRSLWIDPDQAVRAHYDKIHLYDAFLPNGEQYQESQSFCAGDCLVSLSHEGMSFGLSICFDMRFPSLYKDLRDLGADIFLIPSSFARPTGEKHWEVLLRARAIEHGCFVVAAAQSGGHEDGRQTYGHSLVIDPWGDVLLDMGVGAALAWVDLDKAKISEARERLPTTSLARSWSRSS